MAPRSLTSVTAGVVVATSVALGLSALHAPAASALDTDSKLGVASAYLNVLAPTHGVPIGWTGSVSGCRVGTTSAAQKYATRTAINYYRGMGHLRPVALDATLSAKDQRAALMMQANNTLSHAPSSSWRCYSAAGRQAAGNSNLSLGMAGARAISGYMRDPGAGNNVTGHRRWIMYPPTTRMGSGSTSRANALWVLGGGWTAPAGTPAFVSWPNAGYFPAPLEPSGRWSLSATNSGVNFDAATVTVRDSAGHALSVRKEPVVNGYGDNTVVFQVSGLVRPSGTAVSSYTVTVGNIARSGSSVRFSRSYAVRIFNPASMPRVKNVTRASFTGTARVGRVLTARVGTWTPRPTAYGYRWLRDGVPITRATRSTYRLAAADRGHRISVRVAAARPARVTGLSTSVSRTVS